MNSRALTLPSTEPAKPSITLLSGREGTLSDPSPEVLELLEDLRRGEKPQSPLDLSQLRPAGLDLTELELSGSDLSGSDLSGAQLGKTRMMRCKLRGANLAGADLSGAEFAGADLSDCCLEGVRAQGAGFGMTTMQRVRLFGAEMDHATFSNSDLSDSDLRCAKLRQARLHEANLTRVDLAQADLTGANLEGADVKGADFKDTILFLRATFRLDPLRVRKLDRSRHPGRPFCRCLPDAPFRSGPELPRRVQDSRPTSLPGLPGLVDHQRLRTESEPLGSVVGRSRPPLFLALHYGRHRLQGPIRLFYRRSTTAS